MFLPPIINDIVTDTNAPLDFIQPYENGNYYDPSFASKQQKAYPDIKPLQFQTNLDKSSIVTQLIDIMENQFQWSNIQTHNETYTIQALAITKFFKFKDDVVVRVEDGTSPNHYVLQMRSKSRIGKSDLGANAKRIRAFFNAVSTKFNTNLTAPQS